MGSCVNQLRYERWYEENKKDFELKTVLTKKVFKIPYLWIKQSKYKKNYLLFNKLFLLHIVDFQGGFENE